ncbi:flavodoxin family protein [Caloramator proteoclasticus]|uniref:NADPH-dependent FMN reductase n=1 Tax=Caloramator proteoclasticus DSM 10124 TaxID=1121262 RepID=A0A1M5A9Y7_9CLOT|nr:flavodoxin family protein [Caloramator proteoclasticus]SHF26682.1 NADPH-dependent FMN reductase [Caloramator proteoclasticus DSM 10124]
MNVIVLNGSFNKEGKTYYILNKFLDELKDEKNIIDVLNVYELNFKYCIGCKKCEKTGECIYRDLDYIYKKIEDADLVVISSPVYFASFTSPLKALIDRLQVIYARKFILNRYIKPKKGIHIFTAGRKNEKMVDAIMLQTKYVFISLNAEFTGSIFKLNTDNDDLDYETLDRDIQKILKKI